MILVEKYAENYDSRGVTGNNIISYQHNKTTIKLVKNYTLIVAAVFNKRIKKKNEKSDEYGNNDEGNNNAMQ